MLTRFPIHRSPYCQRVFPQLERKVGGLAGKGFEVGKCILIADDSPVIRKTLRQTLEREDAWEVCGEAADGRQAVEKAQRLKPDLVVLDLSMPVMNGLEAARELTRISPSLPLVMFTNFDTPQLTNEALSAGVRAVVPKSEIRGLVDEIQVLLESAS